MNDDMDSLLGSFNQLSPFHEEPLEEQARKFIISNRAFPSAHPSRAAVAADTVKAYILGQGFETEEVKKRKLQKMMNILLNRDTMTLPNSRVLANLVKQIIQQLCYCNKELAAFCSDEIILHGVVEVFKNLWRDATQRSNEFEQPNSAGLLADLRFITAFVADLYPEGAITTDIVNSLIDFVVPLIKGPNLFNLFLYHFLSRGLAGPAPKLSAVLWHVISTRWGALKARYHRRDLSGEVIKLFFEDAMEGGQYCAIPWALQPSHAATQLCEEIVNGVVLQRIRDEDEGSARAREEDSELINAFGKVQLACNVDSLLNSF